MASYFLSTFYIFLFFIFYFYFFFFWGGGGGGGGCRGWGHDYLLVQFFFYYNRVTSSLSSKFNLQSRHYFTNSSNALFPTSRDLGVANFLSFSEIQCISSIYFFPLWVASEHKAQLRHWAFISPCPKRLKVYSV